jgi:hypothetical protein
MPRGPVWGAESEELNATILEWPPGEGPGETVSQGVRRSVVAGADGARYLTAHRRRGLLRLGQ